MEKSLGHASFGTGSCALEKFDLADNMELGIKAAAGRGTFKERAYGPAPLAAHVPQPHSLPMPAGGRVQDRL